MQRRERTSLLGGNLHGQLHRITNELQRRMHGSRNGSFQLRHMQSGLWNRRELRIGIVRVRRWTRDVQRSVRRHELEHDELRRMRKSLLTR